MKRITTGLLFIIILAACNLYAEEQWTLVNDSDGIKTYTMTIPGSNLISYKAVTDMDAPVEVILEVIKDCPSYPKWYWQCKECRLIKSDQSKHQWAIYFVSDTPWPVTNRDMVLFNIQQDDPKTGNVIIMINSAKDDIVPRKKEYVRVTDCTGGWNLTKIGKNKTSIQFAIKVDPAGSVPLALANRTAKDTPFKTLQGMRQMLKTDTYFKKAGVVKN
jgi:hypothetical protein